MMSRLHPATIAELIELKDRELGPTDWHTLTQSDIDAFADVTGDHQWIHVDTARSADGPFGATVAHGLFTLSLGPAFLEKLIAFDGFAHSLNYGYNKVRFPHPSRVGTRLRMRATVTDVEQKQPLSAQVIVKQLFEADGIDKPICIAETIARFTEHPANGI